MTTLAKSIFEFASKDNYTCLMILFDMMSIYRNKIGIAPDSNLPMFDEIESSAFYLIKMAEEKKLNMARRTANSWVVCDMSCQESVAMQVKLKMAKRATQSMVICKTPVTSYQE